MKSDEYKRLVVAIIFEAQRRGEKINNRKIAREIGISYNDHNYLKRDREEAVQVSDEVEQGILKLCEVYKVDRQEIANEAIPGAPPGALSGKDKTELLLIITEMQRDLLDLFRKNRNIEDKIKDLEDRLNKL